MKRSVFARAVVWVLVLLLPALVLSGCRRASGTPSVPETGETPSETAAADTTMTADPGASDAGSSAPAYDGAESTREPVETGDVTGAFDTEKGDIAYSVTVDAEGFTHTEKGTGDRYYAGDSTDVFLEIRYIEGKTVSAVKPSFMDGYVDFNDIEFAGDNFVGDTEIVGNMITAQNGEVRLEAWLIDTGDGVLAVVVSYTQENRDSQMARLYDVLNTLEMDINNEN